MKQEDKNTGVLAGYFIWSIYLLFLDLYCYKRQTLINAFNAAQNDPFKEYNNPTVTSGIPPVYDVMSCK